MCLVKKKVDFLIKTFIKLPFNLENIRIKNIVQHYSVRKNKATLKQFFLI